MNQASFLILYLALVSCGSCALPPVQEGDVIFQSTPSRQTRALEIATGSAYTHVGLILRERNDWVVYEAIHPVVMTLLAQWIQRGTGGHYVVKRWTQAAQLTTESLSKLRTSVQSMLGKNYDARFLWNDDEIYCSELVWKSYHHALGVELAALVRYRDFDLSHPEVRKLLEERFRGPVPLEGPVIPPSALFHSPKLVEIARGGKELQP